LKYAVISMIILVRMFYQETRPIALISKDKKTTELQNKKKKAPCFTNQEISCSNISNMIWHGVQSLQGGTVQLWNKYQFLTHWNRWIWTPSQG